MLTRDTLVALLTELAQWLKFEGVEPVAWVVCGGVAMALQNLNQRTTRDVDVLGRWDDGDVEVTCVEDTLFDFEEKRPEIRDVLQRLGHDDLGYYI